jgi:hypothetical protein
MPGIQIKDAGVWKSAIEVFVKNASIWKPVKEAWIKDAGTWKRFWPPVAIGSQGATFTTSGSFTVPTGIYNISVTAYGGGGGAGNATWSGYYGSFFGGAGGGRNGAITTNSTLAVTPGQVITYTVGAGGSQAQGTGNGASGYPGGTTTFSTVTAAGGAGGYQYGPQATPQTYGQGGYYVSNSYGANQPGSAGAIVITY